MSSDAALTVLRGDDRLGRHRTRPTTKSATSVALPSPRISRVLGRDCDPRSSPTPGEIFGEGESAGLAEMADLIGIYYWAPTEIAASGEAVCTGG